MTDSRTDPLLVSPAFFDQHSAGALQQFAFLYAVASAGLAVVTAGILWFVITSGSPFAALPGSVLAVLTVLMAIVARDIRHEAAARRRELEELV